jgi:hypothetical protein
MSPEVGRELTPLLSALCDGRLTDVQHARLEELLADPACRRHYLEYIDMHARLLGHPSLAASASGGQGDRETGRQGDKETPARPSRRRVRRALSYMAVAAGTLAASLLVQFVLHKPAAPERPRDTGRPRTTVEARPSPYVATLTQTAKCEWEDGKEPRRPGTRLVPGEIRLRKGVAQIRFDGGADLVVEGPAVVRLDSSTAATVMRGKVVFHADELASPFNLNTPSSTLVDLGTEYAVSVGPEGDEVHVFDGEVQRLAKDAPEKTAPDLLKAGEGRRYGPALDVRGMPPSMDPATFVRQVADANPAQDPAALLAYEGFDYKDPELFKSGKDANGGRGWAGPWARSLIRPLNQGDTNWLTLNPRETLRREGSATPSVGGRFEYAGFTKFHRQLAKPVRLDVDAVYYVSFLFHREAPSDDPVNAVAILFRTTDEMKKENNDPRQRLNIGVGGANQIFTHLGGVGSRTPVPLNYGETYLLVAKIAAGEEDPDQVFIRVYGPHESVERDEPGSWTVVGPTFHSDLTFDWLEVHINSLSRQSIDEIRVGTTWQSVAAPWLSAPKKGKP